jgi:hypothetical protein
VLLTAGIITSWQAAEPPFLQHLQQLPPELACQVLQYFYEGGHLLRNPVKALQQIVGPSGVTVYTSSSSQATQDDDARLFKVCPHFSAHCTESVSGRAVANCYPLIMLPYLQSLPNLP